MKNTATILAALSIGAVSAAAGTAPVPVRSSGKTIPTAPPVVDPCAVPISYNNVELLYAYTDWDDFDGHGNGGILRAEYSPFQNFYFTLGGEYHDVGNVSIWQFTAGIGGYIPLTQNVHLAVDGGAAYYNLDVNSDLSSSLDDGFRDDGWGWYVRPHIRARWGCFEIHAGAKYTKVDQADVDEWVGFADLYYQVSPGWDLTAGVEVGDRRTAVTGGARYRF